MTTMSEAVTAKMAKKLSKKGKAGVSRKPRKEAKRTPAEVIARFACCGRCSVFLTAYRLKHGPEQFATAVANIDAGWLTLAWDRSMYELINTTYDCDLDQTAYYFASRCPECKRPFIFHETTPEESASLRIKA